MNVSQNESGDLLFFDAFTRVGPRPGKHPAARWKLGELLAEMDHCSISGAMVSSTLSVSYDAMHSNLALSEQLRRHRHLLAIWNLMPGGTGEMPSLEGLAELMRNSNVRAVTLCPNTNAWDIASGPGRRLLDWLADNRIMTILDRWEFDHYRRLDELLSRHPGLPVLLRGAYWNEQRYVLPLLERYRNLHISFENFQIHYGIEYLCELGHEDQLIFATDGPAMSAGAHRCYVDYADVPLKVRAKVAGGNLIRLLNSTKLFPSADLAALPLRTNAQEDEIMAAARAGKPLPVTVIDMHMHILHESLHGGGSQNVMHRGGPEGVFAMMGRLGCRGGGLMSWVGPTASDAVAGNECTAAALDAAPKGFWGLATFDPTHYSPAEMSQQIRRVYRDRRFIGMKPYYRFGVEYQDDSYDAWWRFGDEHRLYGLLDCDRAGGGLRQAEVLAQKYPDARWLIAHAGMDWRMADAAIEIARRFPNVFLEITRTSVPAGIIEHLVEGAGADRVVYGSDLPMRDPRQQLGWVVFSRLSRADKRKVLALNALNVICPCLERLPRYNRPGS